MDLVEGSGVVLEKYGGKDVDGCSESDMIESGIMEPLPLDQVNNTQGLYNEVNHHYYHLQHSRSHPSTELPVLALQQQ